MTFAPYRWQSFFVHFPSVLSIFLSAFLPFAPSFLSRKLGHVCAVQENPGAMGEIEDSLRKKADRR